MRDQRAAVHRLDAMPWKRIIQASQRYVVGPRLIDRGQDQVVHDEEIGVASGQAATVVAHLRGRQGQRNQFVCMPAWGSELLELLAHGPQRVVMAVQWIIAGLVGDQFRTGEAGEGVDVAVRVIAIQMAVVEPEYAGDA